MGNGKPFSPRTIQKSNAITAIPELLQRLDLRGATVPIDAMGTQKTIAKQIIKQGGNNVLPLKGNQGDLHQDVMQLFDTAFKQQFHRLSIVLNCSSLTLIPGWPRQFVVMWQNN